MPTLAENKLLKRNNILDSAYKLFSSRTVAATAIDDVVKMAGVAKGTFYLYFKDKTDLLEQIIIFKGIGIIKKGLEALDTKKKAEEISFADSVLFMVDYIADFLLKNKELTILLDKHLSFCLKSASNSDDADFAAIVERFVNAFVNEGYERKHASMLVYLITDMTGSVCCDAISGACPFTYDEIFPVLRSTVKGVLEA